MATVLWTDSVTTEMAEKERKKEQEEEREERTGKGVLQTGRGHSP